HPWQSVRFTGFDAPKVGVSMRRAHDRGKCLPGKVEIISKGPRTRDQSMVFTTPRRATDTRVRHGAASRCQIRCDVHCDLRQPGVAGTTCRGNGVIALQLAEIPLRARNSGNASLARALRITCVV